MGAERDPLGAPASHTRPRRTPSRPPTRRAVVSVTELRRRLGQRMAVEIDLVLPPMAVVASRSTDEVPVVGQVVVESIERGVSVVGSVRFVWFGECRRCLDEIEGVTDSAIDEICQIDAPADSDLVELVEDKIDLVPLVRDAVLAGLPLAPLCREDCPGPDPDRYPTLREADEATGEPAGEATGPTDPRWAGLEAWRQDT